MRSVVWSIIFTLIVSGCASPNGNQNLDEPAPESIFESSISALVLWYTSQVADYDETVEVVVEQELVGVSVEMMDWWWDNINTTARYRTWHPEDHISFEWTVEPSRGVYGQYSPGAVHKVRERIGGIAATILITWEPISKPGYEIQLANFVKASARFEGDSDEKSLRFSHEYKATENGIYLRSVFQLAGGMPDAFVSGLKRHCNEEMQYLSGVLPEYYKTK